MARGGEGKERYTKLRLTFLYWTVREIGDGVGENITRVRMKNQRKTKNRMIIRTTIVCRRARGERRALSRARKNCSTDDDWLSSGGGLLRAGSVFLFRRRYWLPPPPTCRRIPSTHLVGGAVRNPTGEEGGWGGIARLAPSPGEYPLWWKRERGLARARAPARASPPPSCRSRARPFGERTRSVPTDRVPPRRAHLLPRTTGTRNHIISSAHTHTHTRMHGYARRDRPLLLPPSVAGPPCIVATRTAGTRTSSVKGGDPSRITSFFVIKKKFLIFKKTARYYYRNVSDCDTIIWYLWPEPVNTCSKNKINKKKPYK